jgi:hypothetical protein
VIYAHACGGWWHTLLHVCAPGLPDQLLTVHCHTLFRYRSASLPLFVHDTYMRSARALHAPAVPAGGAGSAALTLQLLQLPARAAALDLDDPRMLSKCGRLLADPAGGEPQPGKAQSAI